MIRGRLRSAVARAGRALGRTPATGGIAAVPGWTAHLSSVRWLDDRRLALEGWAYVAGAPAPASGTAASVRLERVDAGAPGTVAGIDAVVTSKRRPLVNVVASDPDHDRSRSAFRAVVDVSEALAGHDGQTAAQRWIARIGLDDPDSPGNVVTGAFNHRDGDGSAADPPVQAVDDDLHAVPRWVKGAGLVVDVVRRSITVDELRVLGSTISGTLACHDGRVPTAVDLRDQNGVAVATAPVDGGRSAAAFALIVPTADEAAVVRTLVLGAATGHAHGPVHWATNRGLEVGGDPALIVGYAHDGTVTVDQRPVDLAVDAVELEADADDPILRVTGTWRGPDPAIVDVRLVGPRQDVAARVRRIADGRVEVVAALVGVSRWGEPGVAPLPGRYRLQLTAPDGVEVTARVASRFGASLPRRQASEWLALSTTYSDGDLVLDIGGPLPLAQAGAYAFGRLARRYRKQVKAGADDLVEAVFFTSFAGTTANDNTRACHDEIHRRRPDLTRVWAVADRSVPLPDGVIPVVHRSAEWFDALATSRYIVTNAWLPNAFRRRPGQVVVQTWHGSAFKRLGADRIGRGAGYLRRTREETAQWTFALSQNPHTSEVFRRAYGYAGPILESGYPRDDVLSTDRGERRASMARERLGLTGSERVILYAPTFRSHDAGVPEFDHEAIVAALGDETTVLVRGHSNTMRKGGDRRGAGVIDVTTYPEITDLYLIADVCITDYSSVMFDFTITGKPILFYVPDLAEYRDTMRGTYFDLGAVSPGPLVETTGQLVDALRGLPDLQAEYAARYAAWVERFNPWDDGHATERVVDALFAAADTGISADPPR